jgi:polyisoprenoid-binding protein YceI
MSKTNWKLDPEHSEVTFKVKHMMITTVGGRFKEFNLDASTEGDDFTRSDVVFNANAASVDTGNEKRDNHLRSAEFFDAEKYPSITYKPKSFKKKDESNYEISGELTIRDVSRNQAFDVEFGGTGKDPWGNTRAGFTVTGKINRKDFGLNWNAALETGGVMVSDEVKISASFELIRQSS